MLKHRRKNCFNAIRSGIKIRINKKKLYTSQGHNPGKKDKTPGKIYIFLKTMKKVTPFFRQTYNKF